MTEIEPKRTALLLMDLQPAILSAVFDGNSLVERARIASRCAHEVGILVVYVRVAFRPPDRAAIPRRNKAFGPLVDGDFLADTSAGTDLHPLLCPQHDDVVLTKTRVGAFSGTKLAAILHERGIETLILGGISTGGVVLSTVRDGADRDYRLFVLADLCADPDPNVHRVLIDRVFCSQADIITTDTLERLFPNVEQP